MLNFNFAKAPGNFGDQTIFGTNANDILNGLFGDDTIYGGAGSDILNGGNDDDTLFGDNGIDTLNGGSGHDFLDGGNGIDELIGGIGDDIYVIDTNAVDTVEELVGQGTDTVYAYLGDFSLSRDGFENIENLELKDVAGYVGTGNLLDNTILGNEQDNVLSGYGSMWLTSLPDDVFDGDDILKGFKGQDVLLGGHGHDELFGGLNEDLLIGQTGNDILVGGRGQDFLYGYEGADIYKYNHVKDSGPGLDKRDLIGFETPRGTNRYGYNLEGDAFESGLDKIDLSAIDSNVNVVGDQAFQFIGNAQFSGSPGGALGEVRAYQVGSSPTLYTKTIVEVNLGGGGGNTTPDMVIEVYNPGFLPLTANDFIL